MAVERVREGERAAAVIAAYGFNRTTIYQWLKAATRPEVGMQALLSTPATGRPRTKGATPLVLRPGQRQSISAASAVNAPGAFWFCTYEGTLDLTRFCGHFSVTQEGDRDVEQKQAIYGGVSAPDGADGADGSRNGGVIQGV